ncbi:ATP-dependent helicase HrpB [Sphingorhabdus sp. Alg239-R122]|uniref:ATP-dependent helicase HrpB n=1 Tax=Sphingorhabdus sp. Alg239-R122 TaxID=2305989 RepID=UPI0013DD0244|nr:ATP-dependent helicase HrpB [Sphingorhabdus sp. Alg239-R122]
MAVPHNLPIEAVLPELIAALAGGPNAVLIAPPGAGKTTAAAPALLDAPWCDGQILLLSPRRLAARAAAERMAELAGEKVGETIGYATRMDTRLSAKTRILVMTEGIFLNRIQDDPELSGVSAVLFDEIHERSLNSDFGLALALEVQGAFRPDLRLVAMSATLDGSRYAELMDAPLIESDGRSYPLEHRYISRSGDTPVPTAIASAVRRAVAEERGDILAFLPGVYEIERAADALASLPDDIALHRLYGAMEATDQRAAIRPDPQGRRKVILATSIAETSLTIDGVRVVVDGGMARRPRFDRVAGVTKLVTERASQAAVTQRAGRAARQGSGVAYRLWEEAATKGMPPFDPPEILESDLAPLLLQSAAWGEAEPEKLRWIDTPPEAGLSVARMQLRRLNALDEDGYITAHGRLLVQLPLPPGLAHMLIVGAEHGVAESAAQIAVLLQERGLGGREEDLEQRLARWKREKGKRAKSAMNMARRWAAQAEEIVESKANGNISVGAFLAHAYPDRICRRRNFDGTDWQSSGGRGFRLDAASSLAAQEWLAVGEVQGAASNARILSGAALSLTEIETHFAHMITEQARASYDPKMDRAEAVTETRLGQIRLKKSVEGVPDNDALANAMLSHVRKAGLEVLPWSKAARSLRTRAGFARIKELSDSVLIDDMASWLQPLLDGRTALGSIPPGNLLQALVNRIGWDRQQELAKYAPEKFVSPAGTSHDIDYAAEAGPTVTVRVQALYGLSEHPVIGSERIPLVLSLTSPAGRPVQTTRDLPAFWAGSWADVARDMRGRYPKHDWPDDPASATASLKTKKAQARQG